MKNQKGKGGGESYKRGAASRTRGGAVVGEGLIKKAEKRARKKRGKNNLQEPGVSLKKRFPKNLEVERKDSRKRDRGKRRVPP